MASVYRNGKYWRAQVKKDGVRKSATFNTKSEAKEWATRFESEIAAQGGTSETSGKVTAREVFDRYAREVCPEHKGQRWEIIRLRKIAAELGRATLRELVDTDMLASWKAKRLKEVKPGSVAREMTLLNQVFEVAVKEWRLIHVNPLRGIRKPRTPPHRARLISPEELEALWGELGYTDGGVVLTKQQQVGLALHIALETAMRASEVLGAQYDGGSVAVIEDTKNGDRREVPLSTTARNLLSRVPAGGFTLSSEELSVLFGKARTRCGFPNGDNGGFTFHDSRANALTMLSKKLDVLALAKMVGHRDPRSLMIYYRESAEDIAEVLG